MTDPTPCTAGPGPARVRPLRPGDAPDVLAAFGSAPDMARQGEVTTLEEAQAYVDHLTREGGSTRAFAIEVGEMLVGLVGVVVDRQNRLGWVSYWLHAAHRGRGLATRAVATVADAALGRPGAGGAAGAHDGCLERLELGHRVNNPASGQVALAAGFVREGLEREKFLVDGERLDVATYGRLRSDPWPTTEHLPLAGVDSWL